MENKLAYHVVGGGADEAFQIALFDRPTFLLGYLATEERVYVCDQDLQVSSYAICGPLIAFQTAVLQCSQSALPAEIISLISAIPGSLHAKLAIFLNRRGFVKEALKLSPDADFKFSLALQLGELKVAQSILSAPAYQQNSAAWSELGRAALKSWNLPVAEEAFLRASDLPSLFLLYAAGGDAAGLQRVAQKASAAGQVNLAFSAFFKAGDLQAAFDLLLKEGRAAEAAMFARTYGLPVERISAAVVGWREQLKSRRGKAKLADAIADPVNNVELFEALKQSSSGRTRSVSFDGNVSVVGSTGQVFEMKPTEIAAEVFSASLASSVTDVFSDDQMSLEVNTAGTGTRLEDLDECELSEEQVSEEADLDNLREPIEASLLSREAYEAEELSEAIEEITIEEPVVELEVSHEFAYEETENTGFEPTYIEEQPVFEPSHHPEIQEQEAKEPFVEEHENEQVEYEQVYEPIEVDAQVEYEHEPVHAEVEDSVYIEEQNHEEEIHAVEQTEQFNFNDEHYEAEPFAYEEVTEPFTYRESTEPFVYEDVEPYAYEEATEPFAYNESFAHEEAVEPFAHEEPLIANEQVEPVQSKTEEAHEEIHEEVHEEIHEEIDFGGDGDADGWL